MPDISQLYDHLFNTLQDLRDKNSPMDIDRAKAVCTVGDTIIAAAKTEIDFARVNGSVDSKFFHKPSVPALPGASASEIEVASSATTQEQGTKVIGSGTVTIEGNTTTHRMK